MNRQEVPVQLGESCNAVNIKDAERQSGKYDCICPLSGLGMAPWRSLFKDSST